MRTGNGTDARHASIGPGADGDPGERRLLLLTVAGYGIGTGLTALAQGPVDFVRLQLVTRMFLSAEVALAIVVVAEEVPPGRRGFAISLLLAAHVAGGGMAAFALGPLVAAGCGWRAMYALGLLPLVLVVALRYGIRETARFVALGPANSAARERWAPMAIWRAPYRRPLVLCVLLFGLVGALASTFPSFYAYFLVHERGFTAAQMSTTFGLALLMGSRPSRSPAGCSIAGAGAWSASPGRCSARRGF